MKYDWGDGKGRVHTRRKKASGSTGASSWGSGANSWVIGSGGAPGGGGVPGGPGSDPVGGRPLDPMEESARISAARSHQLGEAQALYQTGQVRQRYGVDDASNPYSEMSNLKYEYGIGDTANPYNRAKMLEKTYQQSKSGNLNTFAGQGQLYSGAYDKAASDLEQKKVDDTTVLNRGYSQGEDAIKRAFADSMHGIQYGRAQSAAQGAIGVDDATYQALLRALGG